MWVASHAKDFPEARSTYLVLGQVFGHELAGPSICGDALVASAWLLLSIRVGNIKGFRPCGESYLWHIAGGSA